MTKLVGVSAALSAGLSAATMLVALSGFAFTPSTASAQSDHSSAGAGQSKYVYPPARKADQVDDYHGVKVADPYRWLEDPDSAESRAWIDAQNVLTQSYLGSVSVRPAIEKRITQLWNYEKFGTPSREGKYFVYSRNSGLQPQSVMYVAESLGGPERVLMDPNTLSKDGTVALAGVGFTDDGKYMAYGIADAGSDWNTWKVRDVATGKDLPDTIQWVKFSGASWTKDGSGFFYSRFDKPDENDKLRSSNFYQKLYFHKLGTEQSADVLVYERKDQKTWGFGGGVTEDGKYLIINVSDGTDPKNRVYYKELAAGDAVTANLGDQNVVKLLDGFDASYNFVGNDGPVFYFTTDLKASRGRLIAIDTKKPARENWKELIPEAKETLTGVGMVGDQFFANYLKDAKSQIVAFDLTGKKLRDVELPGLGTAGGFGGKRTDTDTFYSFASFTAPPIIYRYDVKSGKSEVYKEAKVAFDRTQFEAKQVFYKSKDGTQVPMFIVHKKGIELNGSNPTLLYAYGGFNISITPSFSVSNLVWMEMGGVYAVANIRGGGEYGEEWHQAGTKLSKQNVFDDFIAAGEYLISQKYTSNKRLAIMGGSNGGLLVGACMTQRPDLYGATIPLVGVLDMLRFHKFTIGHAWSSDYGNADDAAQFKALYAYSPLHNIKPGTAYPATMIGTADHDDRVVPAHSFKFAATLQAAQAGDNPILIRIDTRAGHGAGKPTAKVIEEAADRWSFLVKALKMNVSEGSLLTK